MAADDKVDYGVADGRQWEERRIVLNPLKVHHGDSKSYCVD